MISIENHQYLNFKKKSDKILATFFRHALNKYRKQKITNFCQTQGDLLLWIRTLVFKKNPRRYIAKKFSSRSNRRSHHHEHKRKKWTPLSTKIFFLLNSFNVLNFSSSHWNCSAEIGIFQNICSTKKQAHGVVEIF